MNIKKVAPALVLASTLGLGIGSAFGGSYEGYGYGDSGDVYGQVYSYSGSKYVDGYVTDDNGNEKSFSGTWSGYGQVEGYDEDGNYHYLEVD